MDDIHWSNYYNNNPCLLKMDVQAKSHTIPDPTGAPWSPKSRVRAAHILCSTKNKKSYQYSNEWYVQQGNESILCIV